jgi:L-serine dehydratase
MVPRKVLVLLIGLVCVATAADPPKYDYRLLATTRTSTMEKEMNEAADAGYVFGGVMGWDAADERLPGSPRALRESGVRVRIETVDACDEHPNTYRLTSQNAHGQHSLIGISTGGGMIEVIAVDGFKVSMFGDYHETLLWVDSHGRAVAR